MQTKVIENKKKKKKALGLHSTLYMAEELWMTCIFWHQAIRVTHCQSNGMTFLFTHYSFWNWFRHGLLYLNVVQAIYLYTDKNVELEISL